MSLAVWITVYAVGSVALALLIGGAIKLAERRRSAPEPFPTYESVLIECDRYCGGEITAEEYFAAVDRYATRLVNDEVRRGGRR